MYIVVKEKNLSIEKALEFLTNNTKRNKNDDRNRKVIKFMKTVAALRKKSKKNK